MADKEVRLIDANKLKQGLEVLCKDERVDILAVTYFTIVAFIDNMPTIEAEPVNTDKCKALRNIEGIRLILCNVYNTGSTLQDCDYDAIYKRLDVIENILKGK